MLPAITSRRLLRSAATAQLKSLRSACIFQDKVPLVRIPVIGHGRIVLCLSRLIIEALSHLASIPNRLANIDFCNDIAFPHQGFF